MSTHSHRFYVIECDVYVKNPFYDCLCAVIQILISVVLRMSLVLSSILKYFYSICILSMNYTISIHLCF